MSAIKPRLPPFQHKQEVYSVYDPYRKPLIIQRFDQMNNAGWFAIATCKATAKETRLEVTSLRYTESQLRKIIKLVKA